MIKIEMKMNGKKINPNNLGKELEKVILQGTEKIVKENLQYIRSQAGKQLKIEGTPDEDQMAKETLGRTQD